MKKYCIQLFCLLVCLCLLCSCDLYSSTSTGNYQNYNQNDAITDTGNPKEEEIVKEISTAQELKNIAMDMDGHYKLTNHIDLSEYGSWTPIGSKNNPFTGTLDGDGYCIKNLNVNVVRTDNLEAAGLFAYVSGATFQNLGIDGGLINISSDSIGGYAGAFAGVSSERREGEAYILTTVTNCYVTAEVSSTLIENGTTSYHATMAIGSFFGGGCANFTNCYNVGMVDAAGNYADQIIGGFIGKTDPCQEAPMQIKSCYNLGYMSAHFVQGDKPGAFLGYGVFSSYVDYVDIVDSFYGSDANEHNTLRTAITDNDDEDFTSVKSLTVEEMKVQSNFAGFDFDNVWAISPDVNDGYPYLKIQK